MGELIIPRPNEKQRLFLSDEHKYVAYGGARGGGKSWAVRVKAALLCLKYPGIKVMIVRRSYGELQENHILPLCALLRCDAPDAAERVAEYSETKKHIVFPNSSRIIFRYCEDDRDLLRFQGTEVDVLFVDEATHQSEERMDALRACVRGVNDFPKRVYITCNPGGVGHEWVRRLFIDRRYREGERAEDYSFIRAGVRDNEALMRSDPDYIRRLETLPEKLREAWLNGSWDVFEGQFFDDFRPEPDLALARKCGFELSADALRAEGRFCHVIEPFDLSSAERRGWSLLRSYDFGYARPFSCAWWAIDREGVMYRVLELYGCTGRPNEGLKWDPGRQFDEIARIEREHPWLRGRRIDGVADPSIWDASRGESIAETAARRGVYFIPGDNRRIAGWMQCHYRLSFDEEGRAGMYVFSSCRAFLRTVPRLQFSRSSPEDLDSEGEDHAADEWRYACMSRPIVPRRESGAEISCADPLARR